MAPRKNTGRKKAAAPRTQTSAGSRQLRAIVLFFCSVFLLFVVLLDGPKLWGWMHRTVLGLFGLCAYLLPFVLGYVAVLYALDKPSGKIWPKVGECAAVSMLLGAAVEIFADRGPLGFAEHLKKAFELGAANRGGGWFGALLGWPLKEGLGRTGAAILAVIVIIVLMMLITGITLIDLFRALSRPARSGVRSAKERLERRAERAEAEEARKSAPNKDFDIDVPVDDEDEKEKDDLEEKKERLIRTYHGGETAEPQMAPLGTEEATAPVVEPEPAAKGESGKKRKKEPAADQAAEADDFSVSERPPEEGYVFPPTDLLDEPKGDTGASAADLQHNAAKLVDTLRSFGVETRVIHISRGPAVTRYELQPSAGVKISKITNLADDIALNLATAGVRIEAPIPNKPAVGIEVPNKSTATVFIREMLESKAFAASKSKLTAALGKDIAGNHVVADIAKMPHLLIAGATGSGKSVCINSLIVSLLYKATPDEVKLLMIDPKVVELGIYNGIPHLIHPVVTDPRKAAGALNWAVNEMLRRYKLFAELGVRDLNAYNELAKRGEELRPLPQMVIIIDELADLMMAAPNEVEDYICRLAQMARAAGMHLVIATQRPSVDVITGIIKANIPSRIAFMVSSQVDSRTILDMGGAEKLMGRGDMLFSPVGSVKPSRVQGCWVSEAEVEAVVSFVKERHETAYDEKVGEEIERLAVKEKAGKDEDDEDEYDDMLPRAVEEVLDAGHASTSLLQRRLKLGYARAARIVDQLERQGIVGPYEGSKPRTVLITRQQWLERQNRE